MPEWPDITLYCDAISARVLNTRLNVVSISSPFVVRTFDPPIDAAKNRIAHTVDRLGKRIVIGLEPDFFILIHLMIAGRLHWRDADDRPYARNRLATFDFERGTLTLSEAGRKHRASIHLVKGRTALAEHDRGGLDVMSCSEAEFAAALSRRNQTLKRALTDPSCLDGIGNAYSDEILHRARVSPTALTSRLPAEAASRLLVAAKDVLREWRERLCAQAGGLNAFPTKVTAFHSEMAVHGKFGQPCPVCGETVQRIVRSENEINYCPGCQTNGRILKDRSLSRLLRDDWPGDLGDRHRG